MTTPTLTPQQSQTFRHGGESATFDLYIPAEVVDDRLRAMADHLGPLIINDPEKVVLIPILNGATQVMDPLMVHLTAEYPDRVAPTTMSVQLRSFYGSEGSEQVRVLRDFPDGTRLDGRTAVIIDEVVDRGKSAAWAIQRARGLGAARVIVATLFAKPDKLEVNPAIFRQLDDYIVGFEVSGFLLGRGMDWYDYGRWQQWIGVKREGDEPQMNREYVVPQLGQKRAANSR